MRKATTALQVIMIRLLRDHVTGPGPPLQVALSSLVRALAALGYLLIQHFAKGYRDGVVEAVKLVRCRRMC